MRKSVFKDDENKFQEEFTLKFKEAYNINPKKTLKFMELCSQELGYNDLDNSLINKMFNDDNDLHPGDVIEHEKYGMGVVISIDGSIATISFKKDGLKKLMKNHKSIRKV